jgi:5'-nucleotidase / UDP-sugar diphosphatase
MDQLFKDLHEQCPDIFDVVEENKLRIVLDRMADIDALDDKYETKKLNVICFNDCYILKDNSKSTHSGEVCIDFSKFMHIVEKLKSTLDPKPMLCFGGDFVAPSLSSSMTQGAHILQALNIIGTDFGTFGNHEFDYGLPKFIDILNGIVDQGEPVHNKSVTKWIASNMNGADGKPLAGAEKYVLTDWHGVKTGILGLSENWISGCRRIENGEIVYMDYIEEGKRLCAELRENGAEIILAITHNRLENDKKLIEAVADIDFLLGGHDHFAYLDVDGKIVKGGDNWKRVSVLECLIKKGARPKIYARQIPVFPEEESDPRGAELEELFDGYIAEQMKGIIGKTECALDSSEECVRFTESELGNFIADAMTSEERCDVGLIMGFNIKGGYTLEAGDVGIKDVYSWFPVGGNVLVIEMTGVQIRELLEAGVRSLPEESGALCHVSSKLRYVADTQLKPGSRVTSITFDGKPLKEDQVFSVAIDDSTANTGAFHSFLPHCKRIIDEEHSMTITDVLFRAFKHGGIVKSTIGEKGAGRIIETVWEKNSMSNSNRKNIEKNFNYESNIIHTHSIISCYRPLHWPDPSSLLVWMEI